ncbi:MAG: deoxyribodipyrimidine photo-lyase [Geminicoccaceae bacterium]
MSAPIILWLRDDFRMADHPALHAAAATGKPLLAVVILDDMAAGPWAPGGAARWWLHHAIDAMPLPILRRRGDAAAILDELVATTGADAVYWTRRYDPFGIAQDKAIKADLARHGIEARSFAGRTVFEPFEIRQNNGAHYRVYTPYSRMWMNRLNRVISLPVPPRIEHLVHDLPDDELDLLPPRPDWAGGLRDNWEVSEEAAMNRLDVFLDGILPNYRTDRNFPALDGVSRLSPYLRFGQISPRQIVERLQMRPDEQTFPFLRQLAWRDFAWHCLFHNPGMPETSLRTEFEDYPWKVDKSGLQRWRKGLTGYPIIDAGMRELWQTGYMHNRVRMLVGSFLTKDMHIHWRHGEAWFRDTLVDADLANNSMGWQWVTGSGIDAAPYFRIFNPTTQSQRFDAKGTYIRRWVPELERLPDEWIHTPSAAPVSVLAAAGVIIGKTYPGPIVDHAKARSEALANYQAIRKGG